MIIEWSGCDENGRMREMQNVDDYRRNGGDEYERERINNINKI